MTKERQKQVIFKKLKKYFYKLFTCQVIPRVL